MVYSPEHISSNSVSPGRGEGHLAPPDQTRPGHLDSQDAQGEIVTTTALHETDNCVEANE